MDGELATPTRLIGQKFAPGVLRLEDRLVSFTSENRGLVFQAPLEEVQASFRKVYFGLGAKLTVSGKTYRFWFVRVQSTAGQRAQGGMVAAGFEMNWKDFAPARAAVRQWQAALEQPRSVRPRPASEGWAILSYLIGGMAVYGFVGWLIGRWIGLPWLLPVGMLAGLASAIALVILRVTRS